MQKELPVRKSVRLEGFDYSQNGAYFVTICVKDGHEMLGRIVGRGDLDAPCVELSKYGFIVRNYIENIESHYNGVRIDKYVIMANHIHMIVIVNRDNHMGSADKCTMRGDGASRSPRPTNALIPTIVRAFKKLTDREFGFNMWQTSYHDHIIRNESEYQKIWEYIDENPARWSKDKYYIQEENAQWDF